MNFLSLYVPFDMYCNAAIVLKIDFVYKQSKNYHPQIYIHPQEYKHTDAEIQQCRMLRDLDDDGYFVEETEEMFLQPS